jgi:hypothetical protein
MTPFTPFTKHLRSIYEANKFALIVFKLPHTVNGKTEWMGKKYGTLEKGWQQEIERGFA